MRLSRRGRGAGRAVGWRQWRRATWFAASSPALYEAMFALGLSVTFGASSTPAEPRFAFKQILAVLEGRGARPEALAEVFWASLHGIAELSRTKRLPAVRQKERVRLLVELFG